MVEVQQISNINILHPKFQISDLTGITDREKKNEVKGNQNPHE